MKKIILILLLIFPFTLFSQSNNSNNLVSYDDKGNVTYITTNNNNTSAPLGVDSAYNQFILPGFPVQVSHTAGTYHGGPAVNTLVANLLGGNYLQIVVSGLSTGPLYAFNYNGQLLSGWPVNPTHGGAAYPIFINGMVITANWGTCSPCYADIASFNSAGQQQWTHTVSNYVTSPPSASLLSSSTYGIFNEEEDWKVHGYNFSTGNSLNGWPFNSTQSQEYHTPAIADIDNDGQMEIISCSGTGNGQFRIAAIKENGTVEPGWSNIVYNGHVDTYPVVGDVDGDGQLEVIVITTSGSNNYITELKPDGTLKRSFAIPGTIFYGTAPALADLNGDGYPEIIIQTNEGLDVVDGLGNPLPGWPKALAGGWVGNSSPVVGDVDGDQQPDIVVETQVAGSSENGYVHVLRKDGSYVNGWPVGGMILPIGAGAVPAIAPINNSTHNIIIVTGAYWNGYTGNYNKVWAFDIDRDSANVHHGPIYWGQFMHDANHTGKYVNPLIGVKEIQNNIPAKFTLYQNYPNPFNPTTKIKFDIAPSPAGEGRGEVVTLKIYDVLGKEVASLVNEELKPGSYEYEWDATNYSSGVYFYKLESNNVFQTKKMVLMK